MIHESTRSRTAIERTTNNKSFDKRLRCHASVELKKLNGTKTTDYLIRNRRIIWQPGDLCRENSDRASRVWASCPALLRDYGSSTVDRYVVTVTERITTETTDGDGEIRVYPVFNESLEKEQ